LIVWNELINRLQKLDNFAKKIQSVPDNLPKQTVTQNEVEAFQTECQEWHTDCLSKLKGELKAKFQLVYERDAQPFILHPNDFYESEEYYQGYPQPVIKFKTPYTLYFYQSTFDLKTILLEASKSYQLSISKTQEEAIEIIKSMAENFHLFIHYSNTRYGGRTPFITIGDEFDVQDIFRGLLRLFFKDIRKEDSAPSHAGQNSRIDFFLAEELIIVETKKTRDNLREKEVGKELTLDIIYYKEHKGYNTFIGFIYDPDRYIMNPSGLVKGLQQTLNDMKIIILINQG
jgi:hypothetical protein